MFRVFITICGFFPQHLRGTRGPGEGGVEAGKRTTFPNKIVHREETTTRTCQVHAPGSYPSTYLPRRPHRLLLCQTKLNRKLQALHQHQTTTTNAAAGCYKRRRRRSFLRSLLDVDY